MMDLNESTVVAEQADAGGRNRHVLNDRLPTPRVRLAGGASWREREKKPLGGLLIVKISLSGMVLPAFPFPI
jgi:hypothetical protein